MQGVMLNFVFGRTFWSTVIRPAMFFPLLTMFMLPLVLIFGNSEEIGELRTISIMMWGVTLVWGFLFGSWVGWGFAYWRFNERPVGPGMFARYPLVTGLFHGVVYWVLAEEYSKIHPDEVGVHLTAIIFGLIVGPPMALLISTFWRYAPQFTALRK